MPNLIQIKRSLNTANPGSLANGEQAYTANGDILYIGSNGQVVPIGGRRNPGVLTANQAIVTDGTGMIDTIRVGNSTVNVVANSTTIRLANSTSNTQISIPTAVQYSGQFFLHANGSWVSVSTSSPGGSNTFVQFNDSTSLNGTAGFTFDRSTNNATIANTLTVSGTSVINSTVIQVGANVVMSPTQMTVGNSTVTTTQANDNFRVANSIANSTLNPIQLFVGNTTVNATVNGTSLVIGGIATINSTGVWATGAVNAASHTVGAAFTANATLVNAAAINIVGQVNTATFFAGTSANVGANVQITTSALTLGSAAGTAAPSISVANTTGNVNIVSAQVRVANSTATANLNPNGLVVGTTIVNTSAIVVAGGPSINATTITTPDLNVTGNLVVTGTLTTVDTTNLVVSDPLIRLADDQANTATFVDTADIGYFGTYGNTTQTFHTGLFRDASDSGIYKLFAGQIPAPTTTIDTANVNFGFATLQAWLRSGGFVSNTTAVTLTANSTVAVNITANTISLNTALPGTSGGTGLNTYTNQDILVANSTNGFTRLPVGTDGRVLQSVSGILQYADLDGGTF